MTAVPGGPGTQVVQSGPRGTVGHESCPNHGEWDAFLAGTPGGEVTQASSWGRLKRRAGMEVHRLVLRRQGTIVGGVQLLARRIGPLGAVAYVPYGPVLGPEAADEDVARLVGDLVAEGRRRRIRALFVQPPESGDRVVDALRAAGLRPTDADVASSASLRLDLRLDPDELLAGMARHVRADLRRALRQPMEARPGTREDLRSLADLHRSTASRHGFSPMSLAHLQALWDELHPAGQVDVVVVAASGVDVAAILVTRLGDVATERVRGFAPERLPGRLRPNEALLWAALGRARESGARWYDQGGVPRRVAVALAAGASRSDPEIATAGWGHKVSLGGTPVVYPPALELIANPALAAAHRALRTNGRGARLGRQLEVLVRRGTQSHGAGP